MLYFTFPHNNYFPSSFLQNHIIFLIALNILFKFINPEFVIVLRNRWIAMWTPMPKTTINKNCNMPPRIAYIGAPRYFPLKTITRISCFPERFSYN